MQTVGILHDWYLNLLDHKLSILLHQFKTLGATSTTGASYGQGTGQILMNQLQCVGSEARLVDCQKGILSLRSCSHARDAGVRCIERTGQALASRL